MAACYSALPPSPAAGNSGWINLAPTCCTETLFSSVRKSVQICELFYENIGLSIKLWVPADTLNSSWHWQGRGRGPFFSWVSKRSVNSRCLERETLDKLLVQLQKDKVEEACGTSMCIELHLAFWSHRKKPYRSLWSIYIFVIFWVWIWGCCPFFKYLYMSMYMYIWV